MIYYYFYFYIKGFYTDNDKFLFDNSYKTALFYHRFIEASKFAFGLREFISDDNFVDQTDVGVFVLLVVVERERELIFKLINHFYFLFSIFIQTRILDKKFC